MLISHLCSPWKLGWSWRCRVVCMPRTSSDTRWAHRDHERCGAALASFIAAVKNCLWNHDYFFYHFNSNMVWLWMSLRRCHSELRFSWLLSEPRSPMSTARERSRTTWKARALWGEGSSPCSQHGQRQESFGWEGWVWDSLLAPCYTSVKAWLWCAKSKTWAVSKRCMGDTRREIPAPQEGWRGADHLSREE